MIDHAQCQINFNQNVIYETISMVPLKMCTLHIPINDDKEMRIPPLTPINMPELGRYRAGAASIGPVSAQFWHIVA